MSERLKETIFQVAVFTVALAAMITAIFVSRHINWECIWK